MIPNDPITLGDVLVVEDEPLLRELARRTLTRAGYRVTLACDATEAFDRLAEHGATFRAVYVDLTLPGVPGTALLARLRAEHPSLPVVLSSGRDYRTIPDDVLAAAAVLLPKPYGVSELLGAIGRAGEAGPTRFVA
jgi:DNA-binding NtrC family response regulator